MLDRPAANAHITKESPEYQAMLKQFADRDWRINNLYYVLDEDGKKVRYKRRAAQLKYTKENWLLDNIVKAPQLGSSPKIAIEITDLCVFKKNIPAGIIDYPLDDAKLKLKKIKVAYEGLPLRV